LRNFIITDEEVFSQDFKDFTIPDEVDFNQDLKDFIVPDEEDFSHDFKDICNTKILGILEEILFDGYINILEILREMVIEWLGVS
jgi:hypothetical protein